MEIRSAKFMKGVIGSEGLPETARPTVAFFGRSNVGKSSVINTLVRQRDLARSSSRPGRTTEINYFLVNDAWHLADLPGYGYAKLPMEKREKIRKHILWFAGTPEVRIDLAVLVIDAEIGMRVTDREALGILSEAGRRTIILANKSDRGRRNDITNGIRSIRGEFPESTVIRYSSKTGEGRKDLLDTIAGTVGFAQ
ncbi:MAG: ribosome biogenesis GTP-binding protein YsxC [Candidatus Moranbacteria bacterium]|nr:ribosome biogenesis GTP-binding protein YsxC [Candidatus Moranbacteria bacterium]